MSTLYCIATPIGNLSDLSLRAIEILKTVKVVAAEDTRVTKKILDHLGARPEHLISYRQRQADSGANKILEFLEAGYDVAYASDAGTPGVSDPGGHAVKLAFEHGHKVVPVPGASALTALLSVAGVDVSQFLFLGFLPHKKGRQTELKNIAATNYPVLLFESVHRFKKLLTELQQFCPKKSLVVGRELTKQYETFYRGTSAELLGAIKDSEIKGEFVVLIIPEK
jgi:16S rRNA (cytidine1402-2'-O)-methyltransferase